MLKAIIVRQTGNTGVLKLENIPEPKKPGPGQVLIKHTAIDVNFMDIHYRTGFYKAPRIPFIPGMAACGIIEAVGEKVSFTPGQKVVYATAQTGAYCDKRLINEKHLVGVPDFVPDTIAAAIFAKALTAHYLVFRTFNVKKNNTVVVHSAATGTGHILAQWAKLKEAKVIGTVDSDKKINTARDAGCDHVINYNDTDFAKEVLKITKGEGVPVVYDSVGKDTFKGSLRALRPLGLFVSYGQSSGPVAPVNLLSLAQKGLFMTRPTLTLYKSYRPELLLTAIEIFALIEKGKLRVEIGNQYDLKDTAKAHADVESGKISGSAILIP